MFLNEICKVCGCTKGAHRHGTNPDNTDQCPKHQGLADWPDEEEGVTQFEASGTFGKVKRGTPSKLWGGEI